MDKVGGDFARGGTAAEDPIHTEVTGHQLVEPRAAHDQQRAPARRQRRPERRRHRPGVLQVRVALRDHLRHQHRVGPPLPGRLHQIRYGHLRAHVRHRQLPVVLETLLAGDALEVEDRVDADGVRVGADARADHVEPPAQCPLDRRVHLLGAQ
jgi:hypothetical protein